LLGLPGALVGRRAAEPTSGAGERTCDSDEPTFCAGDRTSGADLAAARVGIALPTGGPGSAAEG
jgi:hypothetical protein